MRNVSQRRDHFSFNYDLRFPAFRPCASCLFTDTLFYLLQAADYLEQAEYDTGNPAEDLKTQSLVKQLLYNPKLQAACPLPFDEAKLWQGQSGPELKQQIQKQFKNIRLTFNSLTYPCLWESGLSGNLKN